MKTLKERIAAWWSPVNLVATEQLGIYADDSSEIHDIRMVQEGLIGLSNGDAGLKSAVAMCASFLNAYADSIRIKPTQFGHWSIESLGGNDQKAMLKSLYNSEVNL